LAFLSSGILEKYDFCLPYPQSAQLTATKPSGESVENGDLVLYLVQSNWLGAKLFGGSIDSQAAGEFGSRFTVTLIGQQLLSQLLATPAYAAGASSERGPGDRAIGLQDDRKRIQRVNRAAASKADRHCHRTQTDRRHPR
jgi:hypothetical protein